jgi:hypothetical protein
MELRRGYHRSTRNHYHNTLASVPVPMGFKGNTKHAPQQNLHRVRPGMTWRKSWAKTDEVNTVWTRVVKVGAAAITGQAKSSV